MNYIKDIQLKTNNLFNVIIEIQKGTKKKFELIPETFDKVVSVRKIKYKYPFYYGCFPQTLAGDKDPLDMILISKKKRKSLDMVTVIPLGVIRTLDNEEIDDKLIVVPYDEPIKNLDKEMKNILKFLHKYKGKKANTLIDDKLYNSDYAKRVIEHAYQVFKDNNPHLNLYPKFENKWDIEKEQDEKIKKRNNLKSY